MHELLKILIDIYLGFYLSAGFFWLLLPAPPQPSSVPKLEQEEEIDTYFRRTFTSGNEQHHLPALS
jgi:hypothetical protein